MAEAAAVNGVGPTAELPRGGGAAAAAGTDKPQAAAETDAVLGGTVDDPSMLPLSLRIADTGLVAWAVAADCDRDRSSKRRLASSCAESA